MKSEYLNPEIYTELYKVMQRDNVNALRVSIETGLRIDDVLSLKPDQVRGSKLKYTAKKTGKTGTAKLSTGLRKELLQRASAEWVFPGRAKSAHRTRQTVYKDLKKACKLLGVVGQISPHSARKTFAVELRKSAGLAEVQQALQHADRETTMLYAFADISARSTDMCDSAFAEMLADIVVCKLERMFEEKGVFAQK